MQDFMPISDPLKKCIKLPKMLESKTAVTVKLYFYPYRNEPAFLLSENFYGCIVLIKEIKVIKQ